jgi:hypothetical protein
VGLAGATAGILVGRSTTAPRPPADRPAATAAGPAAAAGDVPAATPEAGPAPLGRSDPALARPADGPSLDQVIRAVEPCLYGAGPRASGATAVAADAYMLGVVYGGETLRSVKGCADRLRSLRPSPTQGDVEPAPLSAALSDYRGAVLAFEEELRSLAQLYRAGDHEGDDGPARRDERTAAVDGAHAQLVAAARALRDVLGPLRAAHDEATTAALIPQARVDRAVARRATELFDAIADSEPGAIQAALDAYLAARAAPEYRESDDAATFTGHIRDVVKALAQAPAAPQAGATPRRRRPSSKVTHHLFMAASYFEGSGLVAR